MRIWEYAVGHVQLTDDGFIEVVNGDYKERPVRSRSGLIVYEHPARFSQRLRRIAEKAFDEKWGDKDRAKNDNLPYLEVQIKDYSLFKQK